MTIETKGERAEDDEGPSPENNRDDDENQREGLAMLLRLREKRGNADVPSVLERLTSFPTALLVSLQLSLLHVAFTMHSRCSPLKFFVPGASLLSLELPRLPWSFTVFPGVPQSSPEFSSLCRSSSLSAGVPPCPPELLLLPQSPFPSEFFGDSSQSFPCLRRAFLLSPMTLLLHHSFAVP